MKLFKRANQEPAPINPEQPQTEPRRTDFPALLPGLGAGLVGLLAAAALLWFGALQSQQAEQRQRLAEAWGGSQAGALQQALRQLQADTQAAAADPQLLHALHSEDGEQLRAAERSLRHWDGVLGARLNLRGQATQDSHGAVPVNFAALDLIRRAENGQTPAPEAYRIGERWLVYSVAPLHAADGEPPVGTLLLGVDLQRLLASLPPLPAGVGQLQLAQQFANGPAQLLSQRGEAADAPPLPLNSGNPNWQLSFTPGSALAHDGVPLWVLASAILLALSGLLLGLLLVQRAQQRRLNDDVEQLGQLLRELSSGKSVKTFSLRLPELNALAQSLARLPRPAAAAANGNGAIKSATSSEAAPPAPARDSELSDPLFQDTDILDIDILDEDQDLLGLEQNPMADDAITPPKLPASIFRAYDIRGVVGDTLTRETAYWIGRAVGSESLARGEPCVAVGRDGRLSGPELVQALIQGLVDTGCQVSDIGMVPTPALYYATHVLEGKSGVMLTGSHNPPDYNGFKIMIAGDTLANEQIQALRQRIEHNDLVSGVGSVEQVDILERYFKQIRDDIALAKPLRVVVDCGNGVAGVIAPRLIESLGCKVIPLYCEVDGTFPNHHPDPGKPENLQDLIAKVREEQADLGLAFDGDGDRVGVVTNEGTIIYPDRLMMLFAKDVVSRNPGADVIFDVKCTRRLGALISGYGGRPVMWKTGHSLIKKKMKETGALLAGEMSGHIFFKERWFGFDDGIYSAARLLEILSLDKRDAEHVFSAFPVDVSTPEINIQVTEESKFRIIERLQHSGEWGEGSVTTLDGVRVDYPKGWGLVRASNTTPVLVLRFEGDTQAELERIRELFRTQLLAVDPSLNLPF